MYLTTDNELMHKFYQYYQTPEILWELLGTPCSYWAVQRRSYQWELCSRCQKSKGTEFPCVPTEIKHCLQLFL